MEQPTLTIQKYNSISNIPGYGVFGMFQPTARLTKVNDSTYVLSSLDDSINAPSPYTFENVKTAVTENGFITLTIKSGLFSSDKVYQLPLAPTSGGKRKKQAALKKTGSHVTVHNRQHVVYEGPRGGKYIKQNGKCVSLKAVKH